MANDPARWPDQPYPTHIYGPGLGPVLTVVLSKSEQNQLHRMQRMPAIYGPDDFRQWWARKVEALAGLGSLERTNLVWIVNKYSREVYKVEFLNKPMSKRPEWFG